MTPEQERDEKIYQAALTQLHFDKWERNIVSDVVLEKNIPMIWPTNWGKESATRTKAHSQAEKA